MKRPIAVFEYEGLKIEVYNAAYLSPICRKLMNQSKKAQEAANNHDAREEMDGIPNVTQIVHTIQGLPEEMKHTYGDLMLKLMSKKIASTGSARSFYDKFVRVVCLAHKLIEKAQEGKFVSETRPILENGRIRRTTVFRFVKEESKQSA